ncbi:hypothetical protein HC864_05785 [Candidatus Gracilibacteria bacterium]|nr:hypothetical protein [Candidatus Gracilibacteria bacterium]
MTRSKISSLILIVNLSFFLYYYYLLINFELNRFTKVILFFAIAISQHYFLNLVHITSHKIASSNKYLNSLIGFVASIFGGVTFADFQTTHMLHHQNTSNPTKDPDHFITTFGPIYLIPFKIFYHDVYFWTKSLWKKNRWIDYILVRVIQIAIVCGFYLTNNLNIWLHFWLVPVFLVGTLNGFFLFYFPHFTTMTEKKWRKQKNQNQIQKIFLTSIDISRTYHEDHHQNIKTFKNYFPIVGFIIDQIKKTPIRKYPHNLKYTDLEVN